jgi:general secretion pathway protein G
MFKHKAEIDIEWITSSIDLYEKDNGVYPSNLDQLKGEYLKEIPKDPWGNSYIYIDNGAKFIILSHGDPSNDKAIYQVTSKET